jgi:predicted metal-dependent enzyme (double-stranded beta helix superfamily)
VTLAVEDIVARCRAALVEPTPQLAMRDVLEALIADPEALERAVGAVQAGGITTLHCAPDLTILRVAWTPGIALNPHEHRMWAAIAMYGGQEDNAFYRRGAHGLDPAGGKDITAGEVLLLGDDVIHSVSNTRREFAVALHVYGGDFYSVERSEWDFGTYEERPRDFERTRRVFEEANSRWREQSS